MTFLGGLRRRIRQRQQQAAPRRDLTHHLEACEDDRRPASEPPPPSDWPVIQSRHPGWWQVHRIELRPGGTRFAVLIAQVRTEAEAFRVVSQQASQARITKWGSKVPPYYSHRDPKVIADPLRQEDPMTIGTEGE